jgi:dihydrolipoamide dehydrogenase
MATVYAQLGSTVTVVARGGLLSAEEPFAGELVADALRERGVEVRVGVAAASVERTASGYTLTLEDGERLDGERLLVAVGRRPLTDDLGIEAFGFESGKPIAVDDRMHAAGNWLYAIGDANGRALFTHMGKYQAWVVAENLLGREVAAIAEGLGSPRVTFTDPQVAAVGKTLAEAREAGIDARAVEVPTDGSAGASFQGKGTGGTSRLVVDRAGDRIVGATFTGFETADFLQAATIAIVAEVPLSRLRHAIAPYPSRSEIWLKLIEKWEAGDD